MDQLHQTIQKAFRDAADYLLTGESANRPKIALTGMDSEHGEQALMAAAVQAAGAGVDVFYIGTATGKGVTTVEAPNPEAAHEKMTEMLEAGEVDGAVTMHFPFPIGVSTVGRVMTPSRGREMFIATTTGTASTDRVEGMVLNTIYGIITAKACGNPNPTVGILNIDGARQCFSTLEKLQKQGYPIQFAESARADGSPIMRGNDVLQGVPNVLVCDPLTGNVLVKMLSAFQSGGNYETTGCGYGPGIGKDYSKLVLILSRASGTPLVANALNFAGQLVKGKVFQIAKEEFALAEKAGLSQLLQQLKAASAPVEKKEVTAPPKEPCTAGIPGIEVMDIEDAVQVLWAAGIYAESAMGCTGPLVMVSEENKDRAADLLRQAEYIG